MGVLYLELLFELANAASSVTHLPNRGANTYILQNMSNKIENYSVKYINI